MNKKKIIEYSLLVLGIAIFLSGISLIGLEKHAESPKSPAATKKNIEFPFPEFGLDIPNLKIQAPIIADVPGDDQNAYFKALENGLAHFEGTKKPGEGGLIFIFGHSSFYLLSAGKYKEIFRNLEKVKAGDEILVWYKNKEYKYRVFETKIVDPSDVSVLKDTPTEQLSLMTCVPPGTSLKRLIVNAKPE